MSPRGVRHRPLALAVLAVGCTLLGSGCVERRYTIRSNPPGALAFVNGPEGKPRRLRGLCAKVVRPGPVRPGDEVRVVRPPAVPGE